MQHLSLVQEYLRCLIKAAKPKMVRSGFLDSARIRLSDLSGGYSWGGANGTQFWIDRKNNLFALFMVQTQGYRTPAYGTFRQGVNRVLEGTR